VDLEVQLSLSIWQLLHQSLRIGWIGLLVNILGIKPLLLKWRHGTSNMKKHLKKCLKYQANKIAWECWIEETKFVPTGYCELVCLTQRQYNNSYIYFSNQVMLITRIYCKADCLKLHARLKKKHKDTLLSPPGRILSWIKIWNFMSQ